MTLAWTVFAIILVGIAVFAIDRDGFWQRLAGSPDLGSADFASLATPGSPNQAYASPEGFSPGRPPDIATAQYALPAGELRSRMIEAIAALAAASGWHEHAGRVDGDDDPARLRYVVHTPLMRYPDTVEIVFIPLGSDRSTVAMLSRSKLGQGDMGTNRRRVEQWLALLDAWKVP